MPATTFARDVAYVVTVVLAVSAHLVLGYVYLVSGLAVPIPVVVVLLVWWAVLAVQLVRWATRQSWWVVAPPVVALATLVLVAYLGDAVLGWTA